MSLRIDFTEQAADYYIGSTLIQSVPIDPIIFDTDRLLRFRLLAPGATAEQIIAGTAIPEDASGYTFSFTVRKTPKAAVAVIEKTTGDGISVSGAFDADPTLNAQWIEVLLEDTDTFDEVGSPAVYVKPGTYAYALKRIDDGFEDVKAWGSLTLLQTAARE